jgi:hypothetical protein
MTQQYLAGELSVLLARLQAVATNDPATRDVVQLRRGRDRASHRTALHGGARVGAD